ncbi:MAG: TIGR03960 family B12-binding radical SAM protein [Myxococcales bacterium]|nr:TIGR03960 family B12-binding radical SAM protein [Myxococcales bacterium]
MSEEPHPYAAFLHKVTKPARYTGGEVGSTVKAWDAQVAKVCLAFPDVYDIGMSHLGFKILYSILNGDPRTLAERCYAPWVDLEAELRARKLPLVSLESKRPLSAFDVIGFSLQFELTYTNILNMLELGRVPLRSADRGEDDPLVIAGGPVATHPEPLAPFVDAIVIGDGEQKATDIAVTWKRMKGEGATRAERLRALARLGAVYVPSLYEVSVDAATGLQVVERPADEALPFPVERSLVDLKEFPFPAVSPTGGPEAIFDRLSIEVARGCTEGCRFCQAGMIYRPVRERDPQEIVDTVLRAVEATGQDEVSLTALSTADVSCISPLIKKVTDELTRRKISLGVSSLRAYGLEPELLDELKRVRATGLTFAPEAGTQRMRDVINKNVTEEQLLETAERVFSRGWGKMKLYFIAGLPTETDEDVLGIVETGARALEVGRRAAGRGKPAEVTVSVSVHVPKPHTPFQWCAMDALSEVDRKQALLRDRARQIRNLKLKTHDAKASVLEGVFARGDRRLAGALERAFRAGARFDSWEEHLDLEIWRRAFEEEGIDTAKYLGTIPISARLPWSHIDVGLEDGFLAREYRKALQSRLSPPCGKAAGMFVHHDNVESARADARRLVCYDCGVACDLTKMREERVDYLARLGADKKRLPVVIRAPLLRAEEEGAQAEGEDGAEASPEPRARPATPAHTETYRLFFEKTGPMALLGHLDLIRELPRVFRRVGLEVAYTKGFHPKPDMTFGPALSLGVASLEEAIDVKLPGRLDPDGLVDLAKRMTERSPDGLTFLRIQRVPPGAPRISAAVVGARYAILLARGVAEELAGGAPVEAWLAARVSAVLAADAVRVRREVKGLAKMVDVRSYLEDVRPLSEATREAVRRAAFVGDLVGFEAAAIIRGDGAAKPSEIAEVLAGAPCPFAVVRLGLTLGSGQPEVSPIESAAPAP